MIDNLTEAIAHAKEVAESKRKTIKEVYENLEEDRPLFEEQENACRECAEEHEQLADWLTELQERREADDISYEGMTVSEALHDLENCVLPVVGGKSIRIAIKALKAICDRRKPYESEADNG